MFSNPGQLSVIAYDSVSAGANDRLRLVLALPERSLVEALLKFENCAAPGVFEFRPSEIEDPALSGWLSAAPDEDLKAFILFLIRCQKKVLAFLQWRETVDGEADNAGKMSLIKEVKALRVKMIYDGEKRRMSIVN